VLLLLELELVVIVFRTEVEDSVRVVEPDVGLLAGTGGDFEEIEEGDCGGGGSGTVT
jgi:hypothetical protein